MKTCYHMETDSEVKTERGVKKGKKERGREKP